MAYPHNMNKYVPRQICNVFERSHKKSKKTLTFLKEHISEYAKANNIDIKNACFIATGSVGRFESLEASDVDLVPIFKYPRDFKLYQKSDKKLRAYLSERIGIAVSRGEDLTKATTLQQMIDQDSIGGTSDSSNALTRRILVLTEGAQAGGGFEIFRVRKAVLEAYSGQVRTRGRHALSLCNDLARYYRTLCIEYKAKVDVQAKDWCSRNVKLRHSRKMWYFCNMMCMVHLAEQNPVDSDEFTESLCREFDEPPISRLLKAMPSGGTVLVEKVLAPYAYFLDWMSDPCRRSVLERVPHDQRYNHDLQNAFPLLKKNSDLMHEAMQRVIEELPMHVRSRIYDWFLL